MANAAFDYRYFVNAPVAKIYDHLAQPENYIGLSPLVVAVDHIDHGTDENARSFVHYRSVERFKFLGFLRYDNILQVTMTFTQPNRQLVSDVDSSFGVKVRFTFDFEGENGGTWVHETINATMPGIFKGFTVSEARRVQLERERVLKKRLEQGS